MNKLKFSISIIAVLLLTVSANCKKDKAPETTTPETSTTTPVADTSVPNLSLTGTPAQNMVTVFEAGIKALETNSNDPAKAAQALEGIMAKYNVSELREKSRAEKEAGRGASEEEKQRMKDDMEKYKELSIQVGSKNPTAFNAANTKWFAAWGIK